MKEALVDAVPADLNDRDVFAETLIRVYGHDTAALVVQQLGSAREETAFWHNPLVAWSGAWPSGEPLETLRGVFIATNRDELTHAAAAQAGAVYIQNPSSRLAVELLDPRPGEEVLDLAAAPGGKSIAIAARMRNEGRLAVVEVVPGRFHRLKANLERCGVTLAQCYLKDGRGVGRAVGARFDRVLLDAPCSSEARFSWSEPGSYGHWSRRKVRDQVRKQKGLLRSAYAALKPGGTLIYSTCAFGPEENERVVDHLLRRTDAIIEPIVLDRIPHQAGLTDWRGKALAAALDGTVRIVPDNVWSGFYVARLRKP